MRFALCAFGRTTGKMITMLARSGVVPMDHYRLLERDKTSSSTVLQIRHTAGTFDPHRSRALNYCPSSLAGQRLVRCGHSRRYGRITATSGLPR
jgi:hypothetical protein